MVRLIVMGTGKFNVAINVQVVVFGQKTHDKLRLFNVASIW